MSYLPIFSLAIGEKMGEARVEARLCTRVDTLTPSTGSGQRALSLKEREPEGQLRSQHQFPNRLPRFHKPMRLGSFG